MRIFQSAYYAQFHCIAQNCPDSCCKEWDVQVDPQTVQLYRSLPGPLGDLLRRVLSDDPEAGTVMTIENGRCPHVAHGQSLPDPGGTGTRRTVQDLPGFPPADPRLR